MKYTLTKLSSPGWEKQFDTEIDVRNELYSHVCSLCREGDKTDLNQYGYDLPLNENSTLDELLDCPCGCEFMVEEIE